MKHTHWKTKDGRILEIATMATDHLERCVAMLDRQRSSLHALIASADMCNGELAKEHADEAAAEAMLKLFDVAAMKRDLQRELDRRTATSISSTP